MKLAELRARLADAITKLVSGTELRPAAARLSGWLITVARRISASALWAARKLWAPVAWLAGILFALARWLVTPKADTPFDVLKHYVSGILLIVGLTALLWAGKQIIYPPIVITVTDLPKALKDESWINPEVSRALIDQIERMRAVVRGERNPTFEAVLNPPNIVVKSGDWSLNIQEQILAPLGSLLGRSHGEVHLTFTCLHPGCVRTEDPDCQTPVPVEKDKYGQAKHYLCLRLTADVRRGAAQRRITPRLVLSNGTYDADTTKQMARLAETVASVADPATAALYFYRRVKQESAASGSSTNDPLLVGELRGEAFAAAEQAETQDASSACWAHSVRAQLAIDRREFRIAEAFIARAQNIPFWRHLLLFSNPVDCWRLIVAAEIAMTRELSRKSSIPGHPSHPDDVDRERRKQTDRRMRRILGSVGGSETPTWPGRLAELAFGTDHMLVARLARAEVALGWFDQSEQCNVLTDPKEIGNPHDLLASDFDAAENGEDADEFDELVKVAKRQRPAAARAIHASTEFIDKHPHAFSPPVKIAVLDFLERLSGNDGCQEKIRSLVERTYLKYPDDSRAARLLARLLEASALAQVDKDKKDVDSSDEEQERRKGELNYARKLYERIVDVGDDKTDIAALARLALIDTAFDPRLRLSHLFSTKEALLNGPPPQVLRHLIRAWQRFQTQLYPTDVRHHAEMVLSFWGAMLLAYYPQDVLQASLAADAPNPKVRDAASKKRDFQAAVQILFPGSQPAKLMDFPQLSGIGSRIGCLCLLVRVSGQQENATNFFLTKVDNWQENRLMMRDARRCVSDLEPEEPDEVSKKLKDNVEQKKQVLENATSSAPNRGAVMAEARQKIEAARAELLRVTAELKRAQEEFEEKNEAYKEQRVNFEMALNFCHVNRPDVGRRRVSRNPEAVKPVPSKAR